MRQRFLLDGMLGSLSRWLRIGGYDTEYKRDIPDDDLIEEALKDDRILLTRDEVLVKRAKKRGVNAIFINHEVDVRALSQLSFELGLTFDPTQARCPKCNHTVEKIAKQEVTGRVPEGTFKTIDDFWVCPSCGSIYWRGSHWPKITETFSVAGKDTE
ncbi:MAG: Mut7-C RNAse domain-containing protein [Candidatus Bathyarchaeota archaeon]|nr:Mut7-C RNAse domain-containing protein [Candidatus Bathyarchaeota archaeon]